ncbi:MAG: hypothetical protein RL701_7925, partial [Pseudomonadota bacterium]
VGLGLAIVERLVSAMGGRLELASALGEGTTVCFTLPLAAAAKVEPAELTHRVSEPLNVGTALVVDDSAPARELLGAMLALSGVTAIAASSAEEARTAAAAQAVDVVFLDYQMPNSDGAEVAAMLRRVLSARDPMRRVPIFMLTANVFAREQLKGAVECVDGILTKPLSRAALSRLLVTLRPAAPRALLDAAVLHDLKTLRGRDGEPLLLRLLPKIVRDMAETLTALQAAARAGDAELLARHAHAAAGHAALVGASACADLGRALEREARDEPLTQTPRIAELARSWAEAHVALAAQVSALEHVFVD